MFAVCVLLCLNMLLKMCLCRYEEFLIRINLYTNFVEFLFTLSTIMYTGEENDNSKELTDFEVTVLSCSKKNSNLLNKINAENMPQKLGCAKDYIQQVPTVFVNAIFHV